MYMSSYGVFSLALCLFMSFPLYVLKSHESFTYVSPDVFWVSFKSLIINTLQEIVRVSFSAPNASQQCGAFLFVGRLVCPARLVYKSRLYKKTSAERFSLVQVSWIWSIIRPIPKDLSRKPRPEMHFGVQARLVHHGIDPVGQIHLEDPGIALIPRVDQYEVVGWVLSKKGPRPFSFQLIDLYLHRYLHR